MNFSPEAQRVVLEAQIKPIELETMVKDSTPFTHEWANRRWMHWMFRLNRSTNTVERLALIPDTPKKRHGMWEECEGCFGVGCSCCGWLGEVWWSF